MLGTIKIITWVLLSIKNLIWIEPHLEDTCREEVHFSISYFKDLWQGWVGEGCQPQVGGILSSSDIYNEFLVGKYGIALYGAMFLKFSWFKG